MRVAVLLEGVEDFPEHEFHERGAIRPGRAGADGFIVGLLVGINHIFYGEVFKGRVQFPQDQGLPEPAHSAVAVAEGMDEFKFIMKNAAAYQQMVFSPAQPFKQVIHQPGNTVGGRGHVHQARSGKNAYAAPPEASGVIRQSAHHHAMGLEQIVQGKGVQGGIQFIGFNGVSYLLDFPERSHDRFPLEHVAHLMF